MLYPLSYEGLIEKTLLTRKCSLTPCSQECNRTVRHTRGHSARGKPRVQMNPGCPRTEADQHRTDRREPKSSDL